MTSIAKQAGMLFDKYYWQTAVLIARNGLARMYRNSFLGMLWTLFQPLTMVLVYALVMPMIMRSTAQNYTLYLLVSQPLWVFISGCIAGSCGSILANGEVLKRCMVSSSIFPIADVLRSCYTFAVSFVTMYIVALLMGLTHISLMLLVVPFYILAMLMVLGAVAIAVAFVAPYVRDIGDIVHIGLTMSFWFTPVIYQIQMLPPKIQFFMQFNPFFILMHPIQVLVYENRLPSWSDNLYLLGLIAVVVPLAFAVFRVCRRNYVYYL
ncbi:MAG TPA: ABC transporter permease [Rickettsiales bacterium]|nr:ABC transporter permease [Rickettsiales bacterium]